ncbi:phosphate-regulating neutral endopeptidase PHEX [Anastrepha obliqua]|uniref:phosphate-regulating neutral endopeptidase PHEX n=1 Tax=Anastrepha obliqua TaxID=95512 RepID=UPI00240A36AD|nr:phosphate-regulating neutral endopeptidase PHEX [Anastrepha obliqua]
MDETYENQRIWTTNNGFVRNHARPATGNLSIHSTGSGPDDTSYLPRANGSSDALGKRPPHKSTFVGVQSKFRRKYYHKTLIGLLILLIIILLITIIVVCLSRRTHTEVCRSKECLRTAAGLTYSMDEETDPCEDFYKFTCGRWADDHPKPDASTSNDWFRERQAKIMRTLRSFLQANISNEEPEAVGKAKIMYRACMNTDLLDKRELEPLIGYLRKFELPLVPSGFNVSLSADAMRKYGEDTEFNWLRSLVLIKQSLGMDLVVGFDIFADPVNRTVSRIALGTPESDSALPFNKDDMHKLLNKIKRKAIANHEEDSEDSEELEDEIEESKKRTSAGLLAYLAYIKKLVELYVLYLNPNADVDSTEEAIDDMSLQAVKFAKRLYALKDDAENMTKTMTNPLEDIVYISVADLQNLTDKLIAPKTMLNWEKYLQLMMKDANHLQKFNVSELTIITSHADIVYLQTVSEYLLDVPPTHIEFYIWLSVVEELILHTTSEMRLLHYEYMSQIIGTEGGSPRSLYCAHGINSLMGMAVSYVLADDDFTRHKLPKVQRMLSDIRHAFDTLVRHTSWMDKETKRGTLQKSASMKSFIGFPDWLRNATALNAHYAGVRVNVSTHLENMVGVLQWQMRDKLDNLYRPEPLGWATSPSNVNAFHTFQHNTITIPIAILQYPFYDLGMEALNYGSVGTILGHELTHGFDDSGRMFDKDGNMVQWWSNETIKEYINRTECFVDQYNHYFLPDIEEYIDGELTLGENIADNGGMREAFHAYRMYVKEMGAERVKLPGLEKYSNEQLFFISFGNLWCETYTPAASRYALEDSHCPGKIRLKGVLSNSEEFAQTFKCKRGSGMNPDQKKCRIW